MIEFVEPYFSKPPYIERPWSFMDASKLRKKRPIGRPRTYDTPEDMEMCLYHCPHCDGECTGSIKQCRKEFTKQPPAIEVPRETLIAGRYRLSDLIVPDRRKTV